jgi:hypothetical protein
MSIASKRTAEILAILPAPTEPRTRAPGDFGRDVLCIDSLQTGRYATGTALIAQRHYHRLITPPGSLRGSKKLKDFGLGIQRWIGKLASNAFFLASTPTRIRAELRKDPQTSRVEPQIFDLSGESKDLRYRIRIQAYTAAGPFAFNVGVDEGLSASYLGLEQAA